MLEVEPEPNIIIPFDPTDTASVQRTFQMFGVACQTIAAASQLIDLMPGNDEWIIGEAMKAYVNIGANHEFKLSEAILIYRGGGDGAFASLHQVKQAENGIPYLAPGEAVTTAFLRTLAQGLGAQVKPEILPDNVLARTPDMLVWWSRARNSG